MAEPFIGEIRMFGGNFAPSGWAFCAGQILSISENAALFSLLGTTYGGNGQSTFALPDLRGRIPVHRGQASGQSQRTIGQSGGTEFTALKSGQIPAHTHPILASAGDADTKDPAGAGFSVAEKPAYGTGTAPTPMNASFISSTGQALPHENRQPYLSLNFIISLEGIYPSQN